ncbi:hypothetical protein [Pseudoalteromonas spongiae]|uniref:hypothetical protein n=1 Tax=Pseudoalteromonas spongiae TaxID=298657 RepID=UPI00110B872E|nr:hypothetical protein [Pseudoalteromonas spongiae]TMO83689.1 hypothetical protein CWC15_13390 [Pseudoalteromonas spongiae]
MKLLKSSINITCLCIYIIFSKYSFAVSSVTELTKQNLIAIDNSNEGSTISSFIKMKLTHKKIEFHEEDDVIYTSSVNGVVKSQILIDASNPNTFEELATILNKIDTAINRSDSRVVILLNSSYDRLKSLSKSDLTISLDAPYPSIIDFYGRSIINIQFSDGGEGEGEALKLSRFNSTQDNNFPILASILIENITPEILKKIKQRSEHLKKVSRVRSEKKSVVSYAFLNQSNGLKIIARGEFFGHDKEIMNINAISYIASLFKGLPIELNQSGQIVKYLNSLIALNPYAVRFGELAFKDESMGTVTLWPHALNLDENHTHLELHSRLPYGKSIEEIEKNILDISQKWKAHFKVSSLDIKIESIPATKTTTNPRFNKIFNSLELKNEDNNFNYFSRERMLSDSFNNGVSLSIDETKLEKLLQILTQS